MDADIKKILPLPIIVLILCGWDSFTNLWSTVIQILQALFPILGKQIIEDYFTSPYFIVSVIMTIGSCFGIWLGKKGGKTLYSIISIIILIINLVSIGLNIL